MTKDEFKKIIARKTYIEFAKSKYQVAGAFTEFGVDWIEIYDEPPTLHIDRIKAESCELTTLESQQPDDEAPKHPTSWRDFTMTDKIDDNQQQEFDNNCKADDEFVESYLNEQPAKATEDKELFEKVYIKSEADLPKEDGKVILHCNFDETIRYSIFKQEFKEEWIEVVKWYLRPVEYAQSQPEVSDEVIKKWANTTSTCKIGLNWSLSDDMRYREGLEDGAIHYRDGMITKQ